MTQVTRQKNTTVFDLQQTQHLQFFKQIIPSIIKNSEGTNTTN